MRLRQIARLAGQDLWYDRLVSLCMVATLVAVIAPLLLLFGLRHGVISTMQEELLRDPRNLEIRMLSSGSYDQAWVDELARRPDVGFVIGLTRSLNTMADFINTPAKFLENVEVLPTAVGDPLLADVELDGWSRQGVVFSAQAAQRLDVKPGSCVRMKITRRLDGVDQQATLELLVHDVLSARVYDRPAAFVQPVLLRDMEWYRDGYAVPAMGGDDGLPVDMATTRYAKVRLYAANMDAVEALEKDLVGLRIETSSRLADIHNVKAVNRLLTTIFNVIAATSVVGCVAALVGAFLANVKRKRRDIATLRLLGVDGSEVIVFIMAQALVLTVIAMGVGLVIYTAGSMTFNSLLGAMRPADQFACEITALHVGVAFLLALGVALSASGVGAISARRIQPAESLREI